MKSAVVIDREMRRAVVNAAERCEYWLARALAEEDAGRIENGICLRFVARQRSEAAFAAVAAASAQKAKVAARVA